MAVIGRLVRKSGGRAVFAAALVFCACVQLPEYCGDGKNGFYPDRQFCFENRPYNKCGGSEFDPVTHGCYNGEVRQRVSIVYNGNGNSGGEAPADPNSPYVSGEAVTVLGKGALERDDYTFTGWNTAADGNGIDRSVGASFAISANTVLYAKWRLTNIPVYAVTVIGGGVGASGVVEYEQGAVVTITAGVKEGLQFKNWATASAGVNFVNASSATTTFIMPGNAAEVTAVFGEISDVPYTVAVSSVSGSALGGGSYRQGAEVTIFAGEPPAANQEFKSWEVVSGGITLDDVSSATAKFTMPANNVSVAAVFGAVAVAPVFFRDVRDNQEYRAVKISGRTWMAQNLNFPITSGSWCYGNSNDSCGKYGRLYSWNAANSQACPAGWRLPTRDDWAELAIFAGGTGDYGVNDTAGTKLKSGAGWQANSLTPVGTDNYGFTALPGGYRRHDGSVNGVFDNTSGYHGFWWTVTESGRDKAYYRKMSYDGKALYEGDYDRGYGLSVRCVSE